MSNIRNAMTTSQAKHPSSPSLQTYCNENNIPIYLHSGGFTELNKVCSGIMIFAATTALVLGILGALHTLNLPPAAQWGLIGGGVVIALVAVGSIAYTYNKLKHNKFLLESFVTLERNRYYEVGFFKLSNYKNVENKFIRRNSGIYTIPRNSNIQAEELSTAPLSSLDSSNVTVLEMCEENNGRSVHIFANTKDFDKKCDSLYLNRNFTYISSGGFDEGSMAFTFRNDGAIRYTGLLSRQNGELYLDPH